MRTDQSLADLHRRLRGSAESGDLDDRADEAGEEEDAELPSWVPDSRINRGERLLGAIRADPGRAGGIALAAVAAVAVLVTVFTLLGDDHTPVSSAKLPPVAMVSSAAPRPSPAARTDQPVVVSVVGLVHTPGLVTLAPNARIADAIAAAGGALNGADTLGLNLARHVGDGEQIVVGIGTPAGQPSALGSSVVAGPAPAPGAAPATTTATTSTPIDLNAATAEQLDALPGVGPVTAAAIVAWRDANEGFASVEQLGEVDGIGPARLDKLRPLVRV